MFFQRTHSLLKSRSIFAKALKCYRHKSPGLTSKQLTHLESLLEKTQQSLDSKSRKDAHHYTLQLEEFMKKHFSSPLIDFFKEAFITLLIALFFAIVFRQMIFEPYEIPTGSMRPTFLEGDKIITSKTAYSLNIPCYPGQWYFQPSAVQRNDCVIFTSEGLEIPDNDTKYFYLFPAKKRLVKRCIGLPGDTLYFYGGEIFGFDEEGKEITDYRLPYLKDLHHIPFISFEGIPIVEEKDNTLIFKQMNQAIGKIKNFFKAHASSYVNIGGKWQLESPPLVPQPLHYKNFFGMQHYGLAKMITKERYLAMHPTAESPSEDISLYLEITHSPNLQLNRTHSDRYITPLLQTRKSYLPLEPIHLQRIMENLYTVRFFVENQKAYRYHLEKPFKSPNLEEVPMKNVPDGLYEFHQGIAYHVPTGWKGIFSGSARQALPSTHPLYRLSPINIKTLFNEGIVFGASPPTSKTSRYAYFKEGDLYLMGAKIFHKEEPLLNQFVFHEKAKIASGRQGFVDTQPHKQEGKLNEEYLKTFGYKVPKGHYLLLGDNHSQSSDSRDFGAIPGTHLRGSPSFHLWPLDSRVGFPNQPLSKAFNLTLISWSILFIASLSFFILYLKKLHQWRYVKM